MERILPASYKCQLTPLQWTRSARGLLEGLSRVLGNSHARFSGESTPATACSYPTCKARKPYEFGVKNAVVVSHQHGLMLGARTFPGNPYDGHILSAVLEQATNLMQDLNVKISHVVADLGFRGVDADNPGKQIIHRGKFKSLSPQQRGWLRRRQAVEPAIGHLKSDHRLDRCWLQGALGDALHAISYAAGNNQRWLLRAIARLGIGPAFLRRLQMVLSAATGLRTQANHHGATQAIVGV